MVARLESHGHEELRVEAEERELARQNADHVERLTVQGDRLTDEIPIAAETALPESIRDDGDAMRAPFLFLTGEAAPDRRWCSERVEEAAGYGQGRKTLRIESAGEVVRPGIEGLELFERAGLFAIGVEVRRRGRVRPASGAVDGLHRHQPVRLSIRQRPEQQRVDDAEHDSVGPDADGQRQEDYGGESRAAPHEPYGESKVLQRRLEDRDPTTISIGALHLLDASQLDQGVSAGFHGAHPESTVVVDVHLQVKSELVVQLAIQMAAVEKAPHAGEEGSERPHDDCSPGARKRPRIADVRCQSRVSRSTRFRPARVRR